MGTPSPQAILTAIESASRTSEIEPSYIVFGVRGVNRVKFSFFDAREHRFIPKFISVGVDKYITDQQSMEGARVTSSDNPFDASFYKLVDGECIFDGPNSPHSFPVWAFSVGFLVPSRVPGSLSQLEVKEAQRFNSGTSVESTPKVTLAEYWLEEGQLQSLWHVNTNLRAEEMSRKQFVLDAPH